MWDRLRGSDAGLSTDLSGAVKPASKPSAWARLRGSTAGLNSDKEDSPGAKPSAWGRLLADPAGGGNQESGGVKLQSLLKKHSAAIKVAGLLIQKRDENQQKKEQLNTVKTEKKAVIVLGTMFGIFFICWAPFFSLNFALGVCPSCKVDASLFKVFLWLGYVSSTLNPLIYTIFNKTFKTTFWEIITCRIYSKYRKKTPTLAYLVAKTAPKTAPKTTPKTNNGTSKVQTALHITDETKVSGQSSSSSSRPLRLTSML